MRYMPVWFHLAPLQQPPTAFSSDGMHTSVKFSIASSSISDRQLCNPCPTLRHSLHVWMTWNRKPLIRISSMLFVSVQIGVEYSCYNRSDWAVWYLPVKISFRTCLFPRPYWKARRNIRFQFCFILFTRITPIFAWQKSRKKGIFRVWCEDPIRFGKFVRSAACGTKDLDFAASAITTRILSNRRTVPAVRKTIFAPNGSAAAKLSLSPYAPALGCTGNTRSAQNWDPVPMNHSEKEWFIKWPAKSRIANQQR